MPLITIEALVAPLTIEPLIKRVLVVPVHAMEASVVPFLREPLR